jgi:hypothetical protein
MLMHIPDWQDELFKFIGIDENTIENLVHLLNAFLLSFLPCFNNEEHLRHAFLYMKGLLSDLEKRLVWLWR